VIREARSTDIDALARIEADRFDSDRLSRRSLVGLANSRSAWVLVATRDHRPIGYAVLLIRRGARSARLYSIAVAAEEAGRGVGSSLLAAAEEAARRKGVEGVHLEVRADNSSAITFYERSGYRPTGQREGYYQDGMAALLFARELPESALSPTRSRRLSRAA
jgi:ribosomal protein S18 acetylase RimI-like enzyme